MLERVVTCFIMCSMHAILRGSRICVLGGRGGDFTMVVRQPIGDEIRGNTEVLHRVCVCDLLEFLQCNAVLWRVVFVFWLACVTIVVLL